MPKSKKQPRDTTLLRPDAFSQDPELRRKVRQTIGTVRDILQGDRQKMARLLDDLEHLPAQLPPDASEPARELAAAMKKWGHNVRVQREATDRVLDGIVPPDETEKIH